MRHAIITVLAALLLAALAGTAVAGPFEDAISAYERGDYDEAARWYRRAAEQGHADGQFNLGLKYANGDGVPQDYVQAHMWFSLAGAQGRNQAAKNRDIVAKSMTPAQIAEAQKLAREWKPK